MKDLTNAIASLAVAKATNTDLDKKGKVLVNYEKNPKFNCMFLSWREWLAIYGSWTENVVLQRFFKDSFETYKLRFTDV